MPIESAIDELADVRVFEYPMNYDSSVCGITNAYMKANNNSKLLMVRNKGSILQIRSFDPLFFSLNEG